MKTPGVVNLKLPNYAKWCKNLASGRVLEKLDWKFASASYVAMVFGMAAHGLFSHFSQTQVWAWNAFLAAFVISPLVFFAFLAVIRSSIDLLTAILISFQNGFFWKDILQGAAPILGNN
ncbi:MAG: hypothetical protein NXH80_17050 [Rhodobacteraceae bacterium]|nr:hypothetical protein [Paracoccaceae bacterium]